MPSFSWDLFHEECHIDGIAAQCLLVWGHMERKGRCNMAEGIQVSCSQAEGLVLLLSQALLTTCGLTMKFLMPFSLPVHCFGIDLSKVSECVLHLFLGKKPY